MNEPQPLGQINEDAAAEKKIEKSTTLFNTISIS